MYTVKYFIDKTLVGTAQGLTADDAHWAVIRYKKLGPTHDAIKELTNKKIGPDTPKREYWTNYQNEIEIDL